MRVLGAAAACLAVVTLSACDSAKAHPPAADTRQVTVIGTGQVQGSPDTLTANVSIEFTAADVTTAMNQTSERQQAVVNALVGAGIDRKDISTTQVSLQPQFAGPDNTPPISGYRANNSIDVKIRRLASASNVLALIVTTGGDATRINAVAYSIDDTSQLVTDARARAFQDAQDRARQYARLSGLKLGKVISISEATGTTPVAAPRGAAAPVPLEPGQQTVGFSVTVVWELS